MNRLEIRTLVQQHTRRTDKDALINSGIVLALQEIMQLWPWRDLRAEFDISLPSGTNVVSLPSFVNQVVQIRVLDVDSPIELRSATDLDSTLGNLGYELTILDQRTMQSIDPNLSINSTGIPKYAIVKNGLIQVIPPTNTDKILRILDDAIIINMQDDTDDNPLPRTDNAVIAWATSYLLMSIEKFEEAAQWDKKFQQAIAIARSNNDRRTGQKRQMRGAMSEQERWVDPRINTYTRQ